MATRAQGLRIRWTAWLVVFLACVCLLAIWVGSRRGGAESGVRYVEDEAEEAQPLEHLADGLEDAVRQSASGGIDEDEAPSSEVT